MCANGDISALLLDILDQVRVDRRDDPVQHRLGAHPSAVHAQLQPGDRVVDELGRRADTLDVVAIVVGLAERRHLRSAGQDVVHATQRREHQRVGIRKLLRLDGELHLVQKQLVRHPVLAAQGLAVQRFQAFQRAALPRPLAFECRERHVLQKMVVTRNATDGRLDRVAPQCRVEVFVEERLELYFGGNVFRLGVHVRDSENDEKREEDSTIAVHVRIEWIR